MSMFDRPASYVKALEKQIETKDVCPLGGDLENDCADCIYNTEYMYDKETKECVKKGEV